MKKMRTKIVKRMVTLVLALAMACTTSVIGVLTAGAYETTPEITIEPSPSGTTLTPVTPAVVTAGKEDVLTKRFVAYQVFSGNVTATNDELDNVDWGNALVISDDTDMNAKYAAVKTLMNKLATTDWDGKSDTSITIGDGGIVTYSPAEGTTDQAGRAFVHIYLKIMDAIKEAKDNKDAIKNAARTAAQEVAQVLDGSYSEDSISVANLFKDAKGTAVTSYMQKFAQAVKDTVTANSGNYATTDGETKKFRKYESAWETTQWKITGIPAGYYFIDDTIALDADLKGDAVSPYMLDVFKSVPVTIKSDAPTLDKTITGVADLAGDGSSHVSDTHMSAAADIGDTVTYQLVGTLPKNLGTFYDSYNYAFTDTLSKGLTFVNADTTVDANDVTVEIALNERHDAWITVTPAHNYYTVTLSPDGATGSNILTVTFADLIQYFKATGNGYGTDRQANTEYQSSNYDFANIKWENVQIRVTYRAKVNTDAVAGTAGNPNTAYLTYSNDPNVESGGKTSTTVEEQPKVYTFQLELNKIDDKKTPLSGAEFTMSKLVEGVRKYAQFEAQSDDSYIITGWVTSASEDKTTFTTAGKNVVIKGLDEGTYRLEETAAPAGYDKVDPFEVKITAGKTEAGEYNGTIDPAGASNIVTFPDNRYPDGDAKLADGFTDDFGAGKVVLDVTDMEASVLPHTGGSGVYFYYIAGGVLVAVALVLLVVSRRRSKRSA